MKQTRIVPEVVGDAAIGERNGGGAGNPVFEVEFRFDAPFVRERAEKKLRTVYVCDGLLVGEFVIGRTVDRVPLEIRLSGERVDGVLGAGSPVQRHLFISRYDLYKRFAGGLREPVAHIVNLLYRAGVQAQV